MKKDTVVPLRQPEGQDLLSTMLREDAQRLIAEALQAEFEEYLAQFAERRDDEGRLAVVRNGWQPRREVLTGLGPIGVKVPKARPRIAEPTTWAAAYRLIQLIDRADMWLSRFRSDRWIDHHLEVEGDAWPDRPFVGITFHYGAGLWSIRHLCPNGRRASFLSLRFEPGFFK